MGKAGSKKWMELMNARLKKGGRVMEPTCSSHRSGV